VSRLKPNWTHRVSSWPRINNIVQLICYNLRGTPAGEEVFDGRAIQKLRGRGTLSQTKASRRVSSTSARSSKEAREQQLLAQLGGNHVFDIHKTGVLSRIELYVMRHIHKSVHCLATTVCIVDLAIKYPTIGSFSAQGRLSCTEIGVLAAWGQAG